LDPDPDSLEMLDPDSSDINEQIKKTDGTRENEMNKEKREVVRGRVINDI
jgi:hypothetical protein